MPMPATNPALEALMAENARLRERVAELEAEAADYVTTDATTGETIYAGSSKGAAVAAARQRRDAVVKSAAGLTVWSTRRNGGSRRPRRNR